jgi:hypothetical protein
VGASTILAVDVRSDDDAKAAPSSRNGLLGVSLRTLTIATESSSSRHAEAPDDREISTQAAFGKILDTLARADSPLAERLLSPDRDEVRIRIDPSRVYTWDFSHRMQGSIRSTE